MNLRFSSRLFLPFLFLSVYAAGGDSKLPLYQKDTTNEKILAFVLNDEGAKKEDPLFLKKIAKDYKNKQSSSIDDFNININNNSIINNEQHNSMSVAGNRKQYSLDDFSVNTNTHNNSTSAADDTSNFINRKNKKPQRKSNRKVTENTLPPAPFARDQKMLSLPSKLLSDFSSYQPSEKIKRAHDICGALYMQEHGLIKTKPIPVCGISYSKKEYIQGNDNVLKGVTCDIYGKYHLGQDDVVYDSILGRFFAKAYYYVLGKWHGENESDVKIIEGKVNVVCPNFEELEKYLSQREGYLLPHLKSQIPDNDANKEYKFLYCNEVLVEITTKSIDDLLTRDCSSFGGAYHRIMSRLGWLRYTSTRAAYLAKNRNFGARLNEFIQAQNNLDQQQDTIFMVFMKSTVQGITGWFGPVFSSTVGFGAGIMVLGGLYAFVGYFIGPWLSPKMGGVLSLLEGVVSSLGSALSEGFMKNVNPNNGGSSVPNYEALI